MSSKRPDVAETRRRSEDWAYLERRRDALGDDETTFASTLSVVLHHKVVWKPYAIWLFRCASCAQRCSSVPGQRRKHNTMVELDLAIADSQWLEELGGCANSDSHVEDVRSQGSQEVSGNHTIAFDPSAQRATWSGIADHRLLPCDSGHQDACWNGILDPVVPSTKPGLLERNPHLVIAPW